MIRFSISDYMEVKGGKKDCPHPILTDSLINYDRLGSRYQCLICGRTIDKKMPIDNRYVINMSKELTPIKYNNCKSLISDIISSNINRPNVDIIRLLREYEDVLVSKDKKDSHKKIKKK